MLALLTTVKQKTELHAVKCSQVTDAGKFCLQVDLRKRVLGQRVLNSKE